MIEVGDAGMYPIGKLICLRNLLEDNFGSLLFILSVFPNMQLVMNRLRWLMLLSLCPDYRLHITQEMSKVFKFDLLIVQNSRGSPLDVRE